MKRIVLITCSLLISLIISGCGPGAFSSPTVTPTATTTPIPPTATPTPLLAGSIFVSTEIHGTRIYIVLADMANAGFTAPSGHRGVAVAGYTDSEPTLHPSKWDVRLRDDADNTYKKLSIDLSGELTGAPQGSVYFEWYFDPIPNNTQKLWLVLPDQIEVDLTELLANLK